MKTKYIDDLPYGIGKNSWKLGNTYNCKCGHNFQSKGKLVYCTHCGSSYFNTLGLLVHKNNLLVNVNEDPRFGKDDTGYFITYSYDYPMYADNDNRIHFERRDVYTYRINFNEADDHTEKCLYEPTLYVKQEAERRLLLHVASELSKNLKDFAKIGFSDLEPEMQHHCVRYFFSYPHVHEAELYLWKCDDPKFFETPVQAPQQYGYLIRLMGEHKAKTLRRILFERYEHEMRQGKFDANTVCLLCRTFTDPNHLSKLLDNRALHLSNHMV